MGIYIHLSVSASVTQREWEKVYQETFQLVKAFHLAERRLVPIRGIPTVCAVPTEEREETWGWSYKQTERGWFADCDFETLYGSEKYFLPRDLGVDDECEGEVTDALFVEIPGCLDGHDWDDPKFDCCYQLWDAKSQGRPYHMYLLAVACLIESRLGRKAYVYGDITKGQCEKAVRMANEHLSKRIHTPDQCDLNRLFDRIEHGPGIITLTECEKLKLFVHMYMGERDAEFGRVIRNRFSRQGCDEYWRNRFNQSNKYAVGYNFVLRDYLLWGFDLGQLCSYLHFQDEDGNTHYEEFVKTIMDTKMHHRCRDCGDVLAIDADDEHPYAIGYFLAKLDFSGLISKEIDRYIPIEEIRSALSKAIGSCCPVNELIDTYLKEERTQEMADLSSRISDGDLKRAYELYRLAERIEAKKAAYKEYCEKYDIIDLEELPLYKAGDKMAPSVMEEVGKSFAVYRGFLDDYTYLELMDEEPKERCRWLSYSSHYVRLRYKEWEKIYDDIIEHPGSFARYYPMTCFAIHSEGLCCMVGAFLSNDDLYTYAFELEKQYAGS